MSKPRTLYLLQFLRDWEWSDFARCVESRHVPGTVRHWKRTAPKVGEPWRIIKRTESTIATGDGA